MSVLIALFAPGSVEAELGRVQQSIFAGHGLVSSIALAPLLPVACLNGPEAPRGILDELNRNVASPYRIKGKGLAWHEGSLYCAVDSGGVWASLREAVHVAAQEEMACLFPVFEGFFLGCAEASDSQRSLIRPSLPPIGFTSSVLAVLSIDAPGDPWWREVSMEVIEERPLRGRRT